MFFGMGYPLKLDNVGALIIYIGGVFYLFAGIAIVCDEFFVPALDVLTEWTGVSDDIAGATFMAAGGSAPELFTSLVGTFKESSVGFGTIVGSAVFNVLFVIGMCAIFSKDLLVLTWWPLFRDATYYSFSLIMLAVFFQDQVIEIWEAVILLIMYFGYVTVMANNERLYAFFDKLGGGSGAKVSPGEEKTSHGSGTGFKSPFLHPGNFRSGVLSHLLKDKELLDKMSSKIVIHVGNMKGNVQETFNKIDADSSGFIDVKELDQLLKEL